MIEPAVFVHREELLGFLEAKRDQGFETCSDLTAVDYLGVSHPGVPKGLGTERFEVVISLLSVSRRERCRIRVQVPESDPKLPSAFPVYPGTDAMEREVYDLFGIIFEGHPDLTRILMPEGWEGHPLRKDYSIGRIPVQFKEVKTTR
jgi:NADH-quinone oxidoreductase subunit C